MDPAAAGHAYEAWQQHYGQGEQGGQPAPPQGGAPGYNAHFDSANPQTGQWNPPPSYNSVAPPPRANRGSSYRDYNSGNGGNSGHTRGDNYNNQNRGSYNDQNRGSYNDRGQSGGYSRNSGSNYNEPSQPSMEAPNANKMVFISGLPQHANEVFIHDVFCAEGRIDINEMNGKPKIKIYQDRGVSKGECTISFADEATALRVVATMNGQTFPGTDNIMSISMAQFSNAPKPDSGRGFGSRGRGFDRGGRGGSNFNRDSRDSGSNYGNRDSGREREDRNSGAGGFDRGSNSGFRGGRDSGSNFNRDDRSSNTSRDSRSSFGNDRNPGGRGGSNFNRDDRSGSRDNGGYQGRDDRGSNRGRNDSGFGNRGASRGAPRGGASGNGQVREGDWMCPCGNNNFSFRKECNSCKTPREGGGQSSGGGQMRGNRPSDAGNRHRPY